MILLELNAHPNYDISINFRVGKIPIELLKVGVDSLKARNIVFGFSWLKKKPSPATLFKSAIKNNYKIKKSGFNKF